MICKKEEAKKANFIARVDSRMKFGGGVSNGLEREKGSVHRPVCKVSTGHLC